MNDDDVADVTVRKGLPLSTVVENVVWPSGSWTETTWVGADPLTAVTETREGATCSVG